MSDKIARDIMSQTARASARTTRLVDAAKRLAELDVGSPADLRRGRPPGGDDHRPRHRREGGGHGRRPQLGEGRGVGTGDGKVATIGADDSIDDALGTMTSTGYAGCGSSTATSWSGSSARPTSPPTWTRSTSATSSRPSPRRRGGTALEQLVQLGDDRVARRRGAAARARRARGRPRSPGRRRPRRGRDALDRRGDGDDAVGVDVELLRAPRAMRRPRSARSGRRARRARARPRRARRRRRARSACPPRAAARSTHAADSARTSP